MIGKLTNKLTKPQLRELRWSGNPNSQLVHPYGVYIRVHDALVGRGLEEYVGAGCYQITDAGRDWLRDFEAKRDAIAEDVINAAFETLKKDEAG